MNDKQWFLYVVDHHEGPFTQDEIEVLVKKGEARTSSYVWRDGLEDWVMMSDVPEFGSKDSNSDGHGPVAMLVQEKPSDSSEPVGGPDLSDVLPTASIWCLRSSQQFSGPHSMKTIVRKLNSGECDVSDAVWKEGWTNFIFIRDIPEFTQQIKSTKEIKKNKKEQKKLSGIQAGVPTKRSGSPIKIFVRLVLFIILAGALYQGTVTGVFDPVLKKIGMDQKVKQLNLPKINTEQFVSGKKMGEMATVVKDKALALSTKLPEPIQNILFPIPFPEGLTPRDKETLKDIILSDPKKLPQVGTAILQEDIFTPSFVVATNLPKGTIFKVALKGKPGTLLGTYRYEEIKTVKVDEKIVTVSPFKFKVRKNLPRGEYTLFVYTDGKQSPEVMEQLSGVKKQNAPKIIGGPRYAYIIDSYFLGGRKDSVYVNKLKDYQKKIQPRLKFERTEIGQLSMLLESLANESAAKFFELIKEKNNTRAQRSWARYNKKYTKISAQVKKILSRVAKESKETEYLYIDVYRSIFGVYQLTEKLHTAQTQVINKKAGIGSVRRLATLTAGSLKQMKDVVVEINK